MKPTTIKQAAPPVIAAHMIRYFRRRGFSSSFNSCEIMEDSWLLQVSAERVNEPRLWELGLYLRSALLIEA